MTGNGVSECARGSSTPACSRSSVRARALSPELFRVRARALGLRARVGLRPGVDMSARLLIFLRWLSLS